MNHPEFNQPLPPEFPESEHLAVALFIAEDAIAEEGLEQTCYDLSVTDEDAKELIAKYEADRKTFNEWIACRVSNHWRHKTQAYLEAE